MDDRTCLVDMAWKRGSCLRRLGACDTPLTWRAEPVAEGTIAVFQLAEDGSPIALEAPSGRVQTVVPGEYFLATPGFRESTRWVVGQVPDGGLIPGSQYWVLADSGIVGVLQGDGALPKGHLGRARLLGSVMGPDARVLNLRDLAIPPAPTGVDRGAPVYLVVGTAAEVGKSTAGVAVLTTLRRRGSGRIVVLKATGTGGVGELLFYADYGAAAQFDCIDFGLATTYPSGRSDAREVFERALDTVLAHDADAVLIECGGDILGANVPVFLDCLVQRRAKPKVVLAASDALAALGAQHILQRHGLVVSLVTGLCTDTPTLRARTEALCGVPARSMVRGQSTAAQADALL